MEGGSQLPSISGGWKHQLGRLDDCFEDLEFPNACVLGIPRTGENSAVSASDLFLIPEFWTIFSGWEVHGDGKCLFLEAYIRVKW